MSVVPLLKVEFILFEIMLEFILQPNLPGSNRPPFGAMAPRPRRIDRVPPNASYAGWYVLEQGFTHFKLNIAPQPVAIHNKLSRAAEPGGGLAFGQRCNQRSDSETGESVAHQAR